jgi:transcription initiation factor IIE alpha subunit
MKNIIKEKELRRIKVGILGKQILFLLLSGVALGLTTSFRRHNWILDNIPKELKKIKQKELNRVIKRLYQSRLIDFKEDKEGRISLILSEYGRKRVLMYKNEDGTISIIISEEGKKKILMYKIENLKLKRQDKWDGYWRIIIFDIPEELQYIRRIFCRKLKEIGMYQLQKSVYIYPFECKDELDFVIEYFGLRPYVRYGLLKEIDNDIHLRKIFDLI